jgi:hypothetical protein
MTDVPETVTRAMALPGAIAADLSLFGGVLRCATCGGERPLGNVAGYLSHGWPEHCGHTMSWVTNKLLAAEGRDVPDGYELVAVADPDWRPDSGHGCRRQGPGRRACGEPSVAALNRGRKTRHGRVDDFWTYCVDHLYGRWVESGQIMHWVLRETAREDGERDR